MNNNHEKFKKAMKTAGLILLAVGIVFIVIGAVDFAQAFKGENRPEKFWAFFVGFPLFAVGAMFVMIGFHREIVKYMKDETMPVTKEVAQELKAALTEDDGAKKNGRRRGERGERTGKEIKRREKTGKASPKREAFQNYYLKSE